MTPYRLVVFASETRMAGKGKRQRAKTFDYAFLGWTADQSAERHRLSGSGTFLYAGGLRAVVAARHYLARPEVQQISVRTNQDKQLFRYYKDAEGRIHVSE